MCDQCACNHPQPDRTADRIPLYIWRPPEWPAGASNPPRLMDPERPMLRIDLDEDALPPCPAEMPTSLMTHALPTDPVPHDHAPDSNALREVVDAVVQSLLQADPLHPPDASHLDQALTSHWPGQPLAGSHRTNVINWIRLKLIFNSIVRDLCHRVGELLRAYCNLDQAEYEISRSGYLQFVEGLDRRDLGKPCLGNPIKWIDIVPYVPDNDACCPIIGLRVVAKWNPHSSSSGVRIGH